MLRAAELITAARKDAGLTQLELAERSGVKQQVSDRRPSATG
ncbi:helix-turn-helix domain-containing protein [Arenivirga flava]